MHVYFYYRIWIEHILLNEQWKKILRRIKVFTEYVAKKKHWSGTIS